MKKLFLIFYTASCIGQVLPTVPENIFRVTISNYSSASQLDLNNQEFSMRGIGRAYFDDQTKNELGFFSGVNDLYHMGDILLNESLTVESYLKNFNLIKGTTLPVFNAGYYDTSRIAIPSGILSEKKRP